MNIYRSQAKHLLQSRKLNGLAVAVICTVNKGLFLFSEHKCVNVSYANIPVNLACSPEPTGKGNVKQLVSEALHYSTERQELFKTKKHLERKAKRAPNGGQNRSKLKLALFKAEM